VGRSRMGSQMQQAAVCCMIPALRVRALSCNGSNTGCDATAAGLMALVAYTAWHPLAGALLAVVPAGRQGCRMKPAQPEQLAEC
jgi:hypothetical protein